MGPLSEILHELIDASRHAITPNRVGELHGLADTVETVAKDAGEVAQVVDDVTTPDGKTPKNAGA